MKHAVINLTIGHALVCLQPFLYKTSNFCWPHCMWAVDWILCEFELLSLWFVNCMFKGFLITAWVNFQDRKALFMDSFPKNGCAKPIHKTIKFLNTISSQLYFVWKTVNIFSWSCPNPICFRENLGVRSLQLEQLHFIFWRNNLKKS